MNDATPPFDHASNVAGRTRAPTATARPPFSPGWIAFAWVLVWAMAAAVFGVPHADGMIADPWRGAAIGAGILVAAMVLGWLAWLVPRGQWPARLLMCAFAAGASAHLLFAAADIRQAARDESARIAAARAEIDTAVIATLRGLQWRVQLPETDDATVAKLVTEAMQPLDALLERPGFDALAIAAPLRQLRALLAARYGNDLGVVAANQVLLDLLSAEGNPADKLEEMRAAHAALDQRAAANHADLQSAPAALRAIAADAAVHAELRRQLERVTKLLDQVVPVDAVVVSALHEFGERHVETLQILARSRGHWRLEAWRTLAFSNEASFQRYDRAAKAAGEAARAADSAVHDLQNVRRGIAP